MILKAIDKMIDTSLIEQLFTQGEKYSDVITFAVPKINNGIDISDCAFVMRVVNAHDEMAESIIAPRTENENILLDWIPDENVTAVPGILHLELIASRNTECIVKYKMPAIYIKEAVMGEGLPVPDVIEEKLSQMNSTLAAALTAKNAAEKINSETTALKKQIDEISGQLNPDGALINEIKAARKAAKVAGTYGTLSERLAVDFSECITENQFLTLLGNEIDNLRSEWQNDIQNAIRSISSSGGSLEIENATIMPQPTTNINGNIESTTIGEITDAVFEEV